MATDGDGARNGCDFFGQNAGLQQAFITLHTPEQNVERVIRTLKAQCVHRHRFESLAHASRVIAGWIGFCNHLRPHQALGVKMPAMLWCGGSIGTGGIGGITRDDVGRNQTWRGFAERTIV